MSSLRSLLDVADTSSIPTTTYYGTPNAHELFYRGSHCYHYESNHNYEWAGWAWCVPAECVCRVQFEIWGGGGGGGGSCCCMGGANGYAGAYNKINICATPQGVTALDCCCYFLCVGTVTCRHPGNGGFDGCGSYVNGPGLNNFCACGGCHGYSCCFHHANYSFGCQTRMNWQTGEPWNRWQTNCWDQSRDCRECCCEEGKEYWGLVGSFNQSDCFDCGNWCMMKWITPSSAYQDGKFGTQHFQSRCAMSTCGREATMWVEGMGGGISGDCFRNGPPGMGGFSSVTYGGGCCCSSEGAAGLVKITYFCKEN